LKEKKSTGRVQTTADSYTQANPSYVYSVHWMETNWYFTVERKVRGVEVGVNKIKEV
jgi:hypothetical protein